MSDDLALRVDEQDRVIRELERGFQQADLRAERRLTDQAKEYEQRVQFLMKQVNDMEKQTRYGLVKMECIKWLYSNSYEEYWIVLSLLFLLDMEQGSSLTDPVLLQEETWTKLTLFILDSSISSKLFFLVVQWGSSLIDPVLLQEET